MVVVVTGDSVKVSFKKGKSSTPPLLNQFQVLSSPADKAESFARKFTPGKTIKQLRHKW